MATRIYALNPSGRVEDIQENVGPTATSAIVALVVNIATNTVTEGTSTRVVKKSEVLLAIENLKQWIVKGNWPPA